MIPKSEIKIGKLLANRDIPLLFQRLLDALFSITRPTSTAKYPTEYKVNEAVYHMEFVSHFFSPLKKRQSCYILDYVLQNVF